MAKKIKTIEELALYIRKFRGTEVSLNKCILRKYAKGLIKESLVVEYLQITQADVFDCMHQAMNEEEDV